MKINFLLFLAAPFLINCNASKSTTSTTSLKSIEILESVADLKNYIADNCRFNEFHIGSYDKVNSFEKFGLDTLQGKYIWYSNKNDKIIINTFLKEKFAVKYAYNQIHKVFPESKGAITLSINSKKTEDKLLADFKKNKVESNLLVSFNDELGYSSEIEVSECDSQKAESILINYPKVKVNYNK